MANKKIKARSKESQKADEILSFPQRIAAWLTEHMRMVLGSLAALLAVAVITWAVTAYSQAKETRAQTQYARVLDKLASVENIDAKAWENLMPELQGIVEQYPSTRTALSIQLDLAQACFRAKRYEQALMWDEKSLRGLSADPALQAMVRCRMALSYQELNKLDDAIAQLNTLQSGPLGGLQRQIYWQLGQLYGKKKDASKALENYQKALAVQATYPPDAMLQDELASVRLASTALQK